jgi:hypothetical protein
MTDDFKGDITLKKLNVGSYTGLGRTKLQFLLWLSKKNLALCVYGE